MYDDWIVPVVLIGIAVAIIAAVGLLISYDEKVFEEDCTGRGGQVSEMRDGDAICVDRSGRLVP